MDHSACSGVLQVPFMDIQANWDDVIRYAADTVLIVITQTLQKCWSEILGVM